jgi:hypothetical protein
MIDVYLPEHRWRTCLASPNPNPNWPVNVAYNYAKAKFRTSGNTHNSKGASSNGWGDSADNIGVRNNHDGGPRHDRSFYRVTGFSRARKKA